MNDYIEWIVQLAIGTMFMLSTASKLRNPRNFVLGVEEYKIIPRRGAVVFAILIILCEGFLAVSHLGGWLLVYAVPLGLALLGSFCFAVSVNLLRRRELPCFCFGSGQGETISPRTLARLGMAISGELLLLFLPGFWSTPLISRPDRVSAQDIVLVLSWAIFVLIAATWMLRLPEILSVLRTERRDLTQRSSRSLTGGIS